MTKDKYVDCVASTMKISASEQLKKETAEELKMLGYDVQEDDDAETIKEKTDAKFKSLIENNS